MAGIVTEKAHWIVKKTKYNENPHGKFKNVYKINSVINFIIKSELVSNRTCHLIFTE